MYKDDAVKEKTISEHSYEKDLEKLNDDDTSLSENQAQWDAIEIPEGGVQGWMTVVASFLFNCATWGSNSAYSIYLAHYLKYDLFPGATKLDYAAVGGICFGCGLNAAPVIRLCVNRLNTRSVIAFGGLLQLAGILLAAFATKIWQIYICQGVMIGYGLGFIAIPSMTLVAQWFRKKRSLAMSITAAGAGVGGIIFNVAIQQVLKEYGLRWALISQAIICSVCTIIGLCLVRTRENEINSILRVWDWKLFANPGYLMFATYVCFCLLGFVVLVYNLADFTISLGYSAHQGSIVACMISVGIVIGRPTVGKLSDKFGPVTVSIFTQLLVGLLCLAMWIPDRNLATSIAFAIIQGGTMGSIWVVLAGIGARIAGLRKLDVALSMIWFLVGIFGMVSPVIGIKLRGQPPSGASYDPSQYKYPAIWCGVTYLISGLAMWVLRGYLIARDAQVEQQVNAFEDNDELHIKVTAQETMRGMFSLSKTRKV
uniref:MFS transporter n=1 Tax=Cyberlindnera americana TaxID=36016 RepID=A0A5P8N8U9_9ASCO|nr:MFS transporter [Cyberlindnera americana]